MCIGGCINHVGLLALHHPPVPNWMPSTITTLYQANFDVKSKKNYGKLKFDSEHAKVWLKKGSYQIFSGWVAIPSLLQHFTSEVAYYW